MVWYTKTDIEYMSYCHLVHLMDRVDQYKILTKFVKPKIAKQLMEGGTDLESLHGEFPDKPDDISFLEYLLMQNNYQTPSALLFARLGIINLYTADRKKIAWPIADWLNRNKKGWS